MRPPGGPAADGRTASGRRAAARSAAGRPRRRRRRGSRGSGLAMASPSRRTATSGSTWPRPSRPSHDDPEHRQHRRHDGRRQPPQDLHPLRVGTAGGSRAARRARPRRRTGQGVPTHSSVPSANCWCFQIGTSALSVSISARDAANASPRWARRRRDDDRDVADREPADPVDRGDAVHVVLLGDPVAHPAQRVERGRVGGVLQAASRPARGRGRGPGRRTGSAHPTASSSSAASTSATSSGVSRRSTSRTRGRSGRLAGDLGTVGHEPTLSHVATVRAQRTPGIGDRRRRTVEP